MAQVFDSAAKELLNDYAGDWVSLYCAEQGIPLAEAPKPVTDSDLSAVTRQADKLFDLGPSGLVQLEAQADWDGQAPERLALMFWLIRHRHGDRPVSSVLVLLRRDANARAFTGTLCVTQPVTGHESSFQYGVIRVWELDPDVLIAAHGPGVWPLALLTDAAGPRLPQLVQRLRAGLGEAGLSREKTDTFWVRAGALLGLRYESPVIERLLGDHSMFESSTFYQDIIKRGMDRGIQQGVQLGVQQGELVSLRRSIMRLGEAKFGPAPEARRAEVEALTDISRLEALELRILTAADWDDLFAVP